MRGRLSPCTAAAWPWDAASTVAVARAYVARGLNDRLPLGRCPPWAAWSVTACAASLAAALASGGQTRHPASADAGHNGGKGADSGGGWCRGRRLFPLASRGSGPPSPTPLGPCDEERG